MDSGDLVKLLIGLSGALAGFLLGQLATSVRAFIQRRKTSRLLLEELKDVDREATRLLYYHARNLQLYGARCIGEHGSIGISNPIYSNYYKDVLLHMGQDQRISFQMIHRLIAAQNSVLESIEAVSSETHKEHRANGVSDEFLRGAEELATLTKHGYSNCAIIKWHVDFHLKNPTGPDMSPNTENHAAYLQYLESVVKEMDRTIETGKTITKETFETIYDPGIFKPHS